MARITTAGMERVKGRRRDETAASSTAASTDAGRCFGSHLSIAGGVYRAAEEAQRLGFETVQVFVKNQRQWKGAPLRDDDVQRWRTLCAAPSFGPPVAHATYLINLASADDTLHAKSVAAFTDELERCDVLGIPYLVVHPGAAGEQTRAGAVKRVAAALNAISERRPDLKTMPLLETTAGQGTALGRSFGELGEILSLLREPQRVGVCGDTCHVFAAGYDIRDRDAYESMVAEAQRAVGLGRIRCWHLNDSRGACGSRLDRHEHIGQGQIGDAGFRNLLGDARFATVPMILETPKGEDERGRAWDAVNLRRLRRLARTSGLCRT